MLKFAIEAHQNDLFSSDLDSPQWQFVREHTEVVVG